MAVPGAAGDAWEVRIIGEQESQETNNVLHFLQTSASADVELHLILALAECYITHLLPVVTSAWKLREFRWKKVKPELGPEFVTIPEGVLTGAGNAAALPSFNSVVVSKRTLFGGRSRRGRFFIPGIPENTTINSSLDTANPFWGALIAFCACLAEKFINIGEPLGTDQFALSVYSRKIGGDAYPLGASGFAAIESLTVSPLIATTRSRKVGRGR